MTTPLAAAPDTTARDGQRRLGLLVALAVAVAVALAVGLPLARGGADQAPPAALDPATLVPSVIPPDPDAAVPERLTIVPPTGTADELEGPFSSGTELEGLVLDTGIDPASVSGTVAVTADVSTLLVLEVGAGWYGADGTLLATNRLTLRQPDFTRAYQEGRTGTMYNAPLPFTIVAPRDLGAPVASVLVGVPSLVNE